MHELAWGIPHSEQEFVRAAVQAGHPKTFEESLPTALKEAIALTASTPSAVIAEKRATWLRKWAARAVELAEAERDFKRTLPTHLQKILAPKRLLLWREILQAEGYPDLGVFDEMCRGTELCGEVPPTGIFDLELKAAKQSDWSLMSAARQGNATIISRTRSSGTPEVDQAVYEKTLEEVSKGWLSGPHDPESLPPGAIVSRRFGLQQPDKVRPIDDMTVSGINGTVQAAEKPRPHSVDLIAVTSLALMAAKPGVPLLGKAFDLKAAYRQLGISEGSLARAFIAVFNPHKRRAEIFRMMAVPFGATRAVHAFLRAAHALWWIGAKALGLTWTCYFDDFICLACAGAEASAEKAITGLFTLLGWGYADSGAKSLEFDAIFKALGVLVDLSSSAAGQALFRNTERRIDELTKQLDAVLAVGGLTPKEAARLRGRMQFADSQLFGRSSRLCLKALNHHAASASTFDLSPDAKRSLARFACFLRSGEPRQVSRVSLEPWFVFTDACFDASLCGFGGVLIDHTGSFVEFFSGRLSDSQLSALGVKQRQTVIFEAELLTVLVAMLVWSDRIASRPVVFYIDNNGARDVAISGSARSEVGLQLVTGLLALEDKLSIFSWFSRVPSPSNIADDPSRLSTTMLQPLGAVEVPAGDQVDTALALCLGSG